MPPAAAAAMLQPRGAGCCGQVHIPHVQPADQAHRVPGHAALKMLPLLMMNMYYTAQHHIARAVGDSKQQHDGRAVIMCCCKAGQVPVCPGAPEPLPCFNCLVLSCAWSCSGNLLRAVLCHTLVPCKHWVPDFFCCASTAGLRLTKQAGSQLYLFVSCMAVRAVCTLIDCSRAVVQLPETGFRAVFVCLLKYTRGCVVQGYFSCKQLRVPTAVDFMAAVCYIGSLLGKKIMQWANPGLLEDPWQQATVWWSLHRARGAPVYTTCWPSACRKGTARAQHVYA